MPTACSPREVSSPTHSFRIWLAGDEAEARRACREFAWSLGECVTVTATEFIYTGGAERGVCVGLVNYPRYPRTYDQMLERARELAIFLRTSLCQWSVLIEGPIETIWLTRRPKNG